MYNLVLIFKMFNLDFIGKIRFYMLDVFVDNKKEVLRIMIYVELCKIKFFLL